MTPSKLIVAPRIPAVAAGSTGPRMPVRGDGGTFEADGDLVMDCTVPGCGWHAWSPRTMAKQVMNEHHRIHHPQSTGLVLLNQPRQ